MAVKKADSGALGRLGLAHGVATIYLCSGASVPGHIGYPSVRGRRKKRRKRENIVKEGEDRRERGNNSEGESRREE